MNKSLNILSDEEIRKIAPSVFADEQMVMEKRSKRYIHIPTNQIIDNFREQGWHPVQAFQSKTKKDDADFRRHVVRLSNLDMNPVMPEVGSLVPQILITNSHNGSTGIQLQIGIFRLVCSNGLVIADSQFAQVKRRHVGIDREETINIIRDAGREFPDVWNKVNEYKSIHLTNGQRFDFATKAIEMRWGKDSVIDPESLLKPRRYADENDDLFTTMNVIQEGIVKGGVPYMNMRTNRLRNSRRITNVARDIGINQELWRMMEAFRVSKSFR